MKSALLITAAAATGLVLAAPAQDRGTPGELPQLRLEVRQLQERVAALEGRVDWLEGRGVTPEPLALALDRIMQIESISTLSPDPAEFDEVERLEQEADALEKTVESIKRQIAALAGRGVSRDRDRSHDRRRRALGELLADYQRNARLKRGEALCLRRQLEEPRQLIVGTDGIATIELRTTRDLSCVLDEARPGSLVSWDGRREAMDASTQRWVVHVIELLAPDEVPEFPG